MSAFIKHPIIVGTLGVLIGTVGTFSSIDFNPDVSATELVKFKLAQAAPPPGGDFGRPGPGPEMGSPPPGGDFGMHNQQQPGNFGGPDMGRPGSMQDFGRQGESKPPMDGQQPGMMGRPDMMGNQPGQPGMMRQPNMGMGQPGQPNNQRQGTGMDMFNVPGTGDKMGGTQRGFGNQQNPMGQQDPMGQKDMMGNRQQPGMMGNQPGQPGMMEGEGQGQGRGQNMGENQGSNKFGGFGSQEEFKGHFEEQFDQQSDQQNSKQLAQMKSGIKQFAKAVTQFENAIKAATKQGLTAPAEMTEAITKANEIISTVQNAQTLDEVLDAPMDEMQDIMMTLQDGMHNLEAMRMYPKIKKEMEKQFKNLASRVTKATKAATRAKIDVSGLLAEIESDLTKTKEIMAQFEASVKSGGDLQEAFESLDGMHEYMNDLEEKVSVVESATDASRKLKEMDRMVKSYEKDIAKYGKQKIDTTEAKAALDTLKSKIIDLKSIIVSKFDPETYYTAAESAFEAMSGVQEAVNTLKGSGGMLKYAPGTQGNSSSFQKPSGFDMFFQVGGQQSPSSNTGF